MDDSMTVWADGAQMFDRVHFVRLLDLVKRDDMVNMNDFSGVLTVVLLEVEAADDTGKTIMLQTSTPRLFVTLIGVNCYTNG